MVEFAREENNFSIQHWLLQSTVHRVGQRGLSPVPPTDSFSLHSWNTREPLGERLISFDNSMMLSRACLIGWHFFAVSCKQRFKLWASHSLHFDGSRLFILLLLCNSRLVAYYAPRHKPELCKGLLEECNESVHPSLITIVNAPDVVSWNTYQLDLHGYHNSYPSSELWLPVVHS